MDELTLESLAKRIESIEKQLAQQQPAQPAKDWRLSIGMFADRNVAMQIEAEGRAIREAEREAARGGEGE